MMRCAPEPGACRAGGTGPLLRPQGCWRIALRATALRAAPDPGDLYGPWGRKRGQATACPFRERGTPCDYDSRFPGPGAHTA